MPSPMGLISMLGLCVLCNPIYVGVLSLLFFFILVKDSFSILIVFNSFFLIFVCLYLLFVRYILSDIIIYEGVLKNTLAAYGGVMLKR